MENKSISSQYSHQSLSFPPDIWQGDRKAIEGDEQAHRVTMSLLIVEQ
jgi:hypothetical protein